MAGIRPDRVAIYVRWSTDDQSEGTTLEVQLDGCRHYALSQGWLVQPDLTFVDDGYSGSSLDRPALTRLRRLAAEGEVDCVVVFKVDRLSRNIVDAVDLVLGEWRDRCAFKSAREPIDTASDLGRVIFSILAMFADFERSQIRERTQSGKLRRIAEGRQLHGEPAFGYRHSGTPGQWVAEPGEATLVRRLFRMAAQGRTAAAICRELNGEGLRTRAGKQWSIRGVLWILTNRLYMGEAVYGRTQLKPLPGPGNRMRRVRRPEPLVAVATRAAPPLVEPELFDRAAAALAERRTVRRAVGPRGAASPHLLVGLARCRCGGALVARRRGRAVAYQCGRGCGCSPITGERAEAAVRALFSALHGAEAGSRERLDVAAGAAGAQAAELAAGLAGLRRQRDRLGGQEQRLLLAAAAGEVDLGGLAAVRGALQAELNRLEAEAAALERRLAAAADGLAQAAAALADLEPGAQLALVDVAGQRELIRAALAEPLVLFRPRGGDTVEIEAAWAAPSGR